MSPTDPLLGGYDPAAGLSKAEAAAARKLPVPSLLRSLLSEHLDPGYAAAAEARAAAGNRSRQWGWQVAACVLIASVIAAAAAQAQSLAPGVSAAQRVLAGSVTATEQSTDSLVRTRDSLSEQVDDLARSRLRGDAEGRQLLAGLDQLSLPACSTPAIGPGLTVTVTEPDAGRDLSDVSKERVPGSRQVILDRDLQLVVNSLWASGAEAVAVGGVRIGPNVTIRQAGGAILVDNHPIASPYQIVAIGPPHSMREIFDHSPGLRRLRLLEATYQVGVTVSSDDGLTVPVGTTRDIKFAKQIGS